MTEKIIEENTGRQFFLHSECRLLCPKVDYNIKSLFEKVRYGHKMSCYWIIYEPFYFFADLDLYKTGYPIEKAVEVFDRYFDQFLVAESPTDSGGSFSVFTKTEFRDKSKAAALESVLSDEIDGLDTVINSSGKFLTKRALYSLHGYKRTRMLLPRLDLSKNMQDKSELELFEYSYPNIQA